MIKNRMGREMIKNIEVPATREALIELLLYALPCVDESVMSEEFNSAYPLELSKIIRAVLKAEGVINE